MPAVTTYSLSGNPDINGLLGEVKWAVRELTFSFPASGSLYERSYGYDEPSDNFESLNAAQQSAARAALSLYASLSALKFSEIAETSTRHADLRFAESDTPPTAWAYLPTTAPEGGDVWFNNSRGLYDSPARGDYAYATFLHETGHGLGLHHPHSNNAMPVDRDSLEYTVMSYQSYIGAPLTQGYTNETWGYPQTPMMYDIAAIQYLYGPNYAVNSANTTYAWSPRTGEMFIDGVGQGAPGANRIFLTVWDGGGTDTYDLSNYASNLRVDLRPGEWTTTSIDQLARLHFNGSELAAGNIANALLFNGDPRSLIENAKGGTGHDLMLGNLGANVLWGHNGNDRLFGLTGHDRLLGGSGHDFLAGGPGDDLHFGQGGSDRLAAGRGDDVLRGGGGSDLVFGSAGEDRVFGGRGEDAVLGGRGRDLLVGGPDADSFVFRDIRESPPSLDRDIIRDFSRPEGDVIDLTAIDADVTTGADDAFMFIGTARFSGTAGELRYAPTSGGHAIARGDIDGSAGDDFHLVVAFTTTLSADDFLL